jgi:hypothetical protein
MQAVLFLCSNVESRPRTFLLCVLLLAFLSSEMQFASAQRVKKNPDGTVEVYDEDTASAPPAPVSTSKKHSAASKAGAGKASTGKVSAYTKKSNGVTVTRHADGTVDVYDSSVDSSPQHSSHSSSSRAGTSYSAGQKVTRHSDGRVDVYDTTMTAAPAKTRAGKLGSYKKNYGDVSVKRNADGTVEVVDTSSTTRRKK